MLFCIVPAAVAIMKESITPTGTKKTALEIISLVEIFNLERKDIFTPW
jgi:hypothetical protein